jgi:ferredoxin-NADP reductase
MFTAIQNFTQKKVTFLSKKYEAQNAYTFTFTKPKGSYKAGQHFMFILKHENSDNRKSMRIFSASSAPDDQHLSITTRIFEKDSSSFKKALHAMKPGDPIMVAGPMPLRDVFKINDHTKKQVIIVGGVGSAPLYSILRDELKHQRGTEMEIFYANRGTDFIFGNEIETIVSTLKHVSLHKVMSPKKITAVNLKNAITEDAIVTLSGTEEFADYYVDLLRTQLGISKRRIHSYKQKPVFGGGYS